jgi:hypothetical protein
MNQFERDLVSSLFAAVTCRLEDAQPFAVKGQSRRETPEDYAALVKIVSEFTLEVTQLIVAISVIVGSSVNDDPAKLPSPWSR